jgi:GNAT superfamily N-acetyltransferase
VTPSLDVHEITAAETHDLRRRVLRDGSMAATVEWPDDDEPTTAHLSVTVDGRIVAISTWLATPDPIAPNHRSLQLRGMATDPTMTGRGLGRALLDAGMQRASNGGHERVWANARVAALGFYEAAGWAATGPVFATPSTGLPHRHVHVDLA